jgi:ribosomal-protein-alanine N-acetyltransferase
MAEQTATSNIQPPRQSVTVGDLKIRRMRPEDIPGVMLIESVSFGRHHWQPDSFMAEMNNPIGRYFSLLLPQPDGTEKLIGYGGFWHIIDEAHVTTVAISPEYRGNALGEILFLQMLEHCYKLSVHWITLEVRTSNYAAQNLYYKYGLKSVGMRAKYYQDNQEDALIMTSDNLTDSGQRALYNESKTKLLKRIQAFPKQFGD